MNLESAVSKTREALRIKYLALKTEESYVGWLCRFSRFVSERCRDGTPEAMGHKQLETTMGYLHAEALSVRSPLD